MVIRAEVRKLPVNIAVENIKLTLAQIISTCFQDYKANLDYLIKTSFKLCYFSLTRKYILREK